MAVITPDEETVATEELSLDHVSSWLYAFDGEIAAFKDFVLPIDNSTLVKSRAIPITF